MQIRLDPHHAREIHDRRAMDASESRRLERREHVVHQYPDDVRKDRGTVTSLPGGRVSIDHDGSGPEPAFTLGDEQNETSLMSRAIRVNGVVRWEYCSGSAIYFVWQQTRDGTAVLDDASLAREASRVFGVPAKNVIHLKASYRFGR